MNRDLKSDRYTTYFPTKYTYNLFFVGNLKSNNFML